MFIEMESLIEKFYKTYYKIEAINLNHVINCLTTTELHIIEAIGKDSLTMNELSDKLGITMGTASVAINKLTEKNFIERERSNIDRRKVMVHLSKKGILAFDYHGTFHNNILEKITEDIPDDELKTFLETFRKILSNLNEVKKDIQPESILTCNPGDEVQVFSIKGSLAIKKYLNEKGIVSKSIIKINEINKHMLSINVDGLSRLIGVDDAQGIMVIKNYI